MKQRKDELMKTTAIGLSSAVAAVGMLFTAHGAQAQVATTHLAYSCNTTAQHTGDCIGFTMTAGDNPYKAAVASALRMGRLNAARHFDQISRSGVSTTVAREIAAALKVAATDPSGAADLLDGGNAPTEIRAAASRPPESENGETKAISLYKWELHGSTRTRVYYGECDPRCHSDGSEWFDLQADSYHPSDGAHWYHKITYASGDPVRITSLKVRLMRDVRHGSDTTKQTLKCTSSGMPVECSHYSRKGTQKGHWYYFRLDLTNNPHGDAPSVYQGQTRRYDVVNSHNWQFIAAEYGG